jgi:hypothetical protein
MALWRHLNTVLLIIAIVLGLVCLAGRHGGSGESASTAPPTPAAPATEQVLPAAADLYVSSSQPAQGRTEQLRIDGDPTTITLVQFDLRGFARAFQEARLRLFALSSSRVGYVVRVSHIGALDPDKATFTDARKVGAGGAAFSGSFEENAWASADVTSLVNRAIGRIVTLAVSTTGPTNISLTSLEGDQQSPELLVRSGPTAPPPDTAKGTTIVFAAGDIASCDSDGDEATAALIQEPGATVLTLGDTVYETGSAGQFERCYAPSWGTFKDRTRPVVGNHEYLTPDAAGYFEYFGDAAGERSRLYYSFDLGAWHLVALNSNCSMVGGCGAGSPQERWLRDDLAKHSTRCTIAFWHHPRFSSGKHGSFESMMPIWQALYDAKAELVLGGHDHHYERFAPQTPDGRGDAARGIRQFVVGTGGKGLTSIGDPIANSEVQSDEVLGVLRLALAPDSYEWKFISARGEQFTDAGSGECR